MAQPKPEESATLDQVLKLVNQLTAEDQEKLMDEMNLQWLRREVQIGIDQADKGELIDGDEVFAELEQRYQAKSDNK